MFGSKNVTHGVLHVESHFPPPPLSLKEGKGPSYLGNVRAQA